MLRSIMYVTTPSGCSLRRCVSASMPSPIKSSERNRSSACCLVRDMTARTILAEATSLFKSHSNSGDSLNGNIPGTFPSSFPAILQISHQSEDSRDHGQPNEGVQSWFVIFREE